jgi:hypothetical protein
MRLDPTGDELLGLILEDHGGLLCCPTGTRPVLLAPDGTYTK